jgi:DNA ligase (NAD+)
MNYKDENAGILEDMSFVITGTFNLLKRSEIEKLIEQNGGKLQTSVGQNTDRLICGDSPGSKLSKATELGIEILTEESFLESINYTIKADSTNDSEQNSLF